MRLLEVDGLKVPEVAKRVLFSGWKDGGTSVEISPARPVEKG